MQNCMLNLFSSCRDYTELIYVDRRDWRQDLSLWVLSWCIYRSCSCRYDSQGMTLANTSTQRIHSLTPLFHFQVGLLPPCNHQQVPFAYKMFTRTDQLGWEQSTAFKKAFSVDVDVEFIGVWSVLYHHTLASRSSHLVRFRDTVTSVGLIPRTLPFTTSNTSVRTFRHAVSLDEHRAKFKANLFNRPTKAEAQLGTHPGDMPKSDGIPTTLATGIDGSSSGTSSGKHGKNGVHKRPGNSRRKFEREFSERDGHIEQTDVKEVWFAGCHCGAYIIDILLCRRFIDVCFFRCRRWLRLQRHPPQPRSNSSTLDDS